MATVCKHNERARYCWQCKDEQIERLKRELAAKRDAEWWKRLFETGYEMEDGSPAVALFLPEHWYSNGDADEAERLVAQRRREK